MQAKRKVVLVTAAVLATTAMVTPVLAASHKPGEMTCEEFLALDDLAKPKVVYWSEGFNKKGKPMDAVIDVEETDRLIPVIVTECKATPKASFWEKIKEHLHLDSNVMSE